MTADTAAHRSTVLRDLGAIRSGPQEITASRLAGDHPELPVERWAAVLVEMARPSMSGTRLLYRSPGGFALAPAGWSAARRLGGAT